MVKDQSSEFVRVECINFESLKEQRKEGGDETTMFTEDDYTSFTQKETETPVGSPQEDVVQGQMKKSSCSAGV